MDDQITRRSAAGKHARHHVKIRLVYVGGVPWKWRGVCSCGWQCLSWQWIAVDRPGGALPMGIEHVESAAA